MYVEAFLRWNNPFLLFSYCKYKHNGNGNYGRHERFCFAVMLIFNKQFKKEKNMQTWNASDTRRELCNKIQGPKKCKCASLFAFLFEVCVVIVIVAWYILKKSLCYLKWNNGDRNYDHSSNYPRQPKLASNFLIHQPLPNMKKAQHEHNTWNALRDRNVEYCFVK